MVTLVDEAIRLRDADGKSERLGEGLQGVIEEPAMYLGIHHSLWKWQGLLFSAKLKDSLSPANKAPIKKQTLLSRRLS